MWKRRRNQALDGLDDEIRDHIERETEINIARGMSPDEARRQARIAFGSVALVHEDARAAWNWSWLEQAHQDLRFGARILKNSPGLSVTAALLIALVIGINTTIFSIVQQFLINGFGGLFPLFGWTPRFAQNHTPRFPVPQFTPRSEPTSTQPGSTGGTPAASARRSTADSAAGTIRPAKRSSRRGRRR